MDSREELYARMRSGEPYLAEPQLLEDYKRTIGLLMRFNAEADFDARMAVLREISGRDIPAGVQVIPPFHTDFGRFIEFGENVFVNFGCTFCDQGGIRLGNRVKLGPNVSLITTNHLLEPDKRRWMVNKPIVIGDDVWIGAGASVLPGVTIGDGAVVGAASVVTKDVPPMSVVVGNPARVVRKIE